MRYALTLALSLMLLAPVAAAALPAQPQVFAIATASNPFFFAESPLDAANTLRVEAAGSATAQLIHKATGAVVAEVTVTGAGSVTFPAASGDHRLTLLLHSGAFAVATVDRAP